ncbi:hydroxymethylbilane synthase [Rhodobacteraceae bacterium]|nr:hydroxymethylbilane synthase [Paracoccaceae bacterium]
MLNNAPIILPDPSKPCRIGTRGSPLALAQAYETRARLSGAFDLSKDCFQIVVIKTTGDRVTDRPLSEIGGKGLFTKEIEEALLSSDIDLAVHSMKDMPVEQPDGLVVDACLPREDVRDAFVSLDGRALADLDAGTIVGTSSLRRRAQLLHRRSDLNVVEFRGKVAEGTFLAMAGLSRLGLLAEVNAVPVSEDDMLPAVAQGAIGLERRIEDDRVAAMFDGIRHPETETRQAAERAFLKRLDGSCQTPIAALAELNGDRMTFRGEILRPDGSRVYAGMREGVACDAAAMGIDLANELLAQAGPGFFDP